LAVRQGFEPWVEV